MIPEAEFAHAIRMQQREYPHTPYGRAMRWWHQSPPTCLLVQLWAAQLMSMQYIWAETKRSKRSFAIGLFTVWLVVFFVGLLENSVSSRRSSL